MPLRRQIYMELPDGNLANHGDELAKHIRAVTEDIQPEHIYTTGPGGYDRHSDHIAMHTAALQAASSEQTVWGLAADQRGERHVSGDISHKLGALSFHASQRVTPDMTHWGNATVYTPLIVSGETYTIAV